MTLIMETLTPALCALIEKYEQGPLILRTALADFPEAQFKVPSPPGLWSAHQVVCHLADFETVYADRIKAVVAEDGPQIPGRDDSRFAARLHYEDRILSDELLLIESVRRQVARLLKSLTIAEYQRVGIHSVDGPLSLETLVTRIAGHIPHHADFIQNKKRLLLKPV